MKLSYCLPVYNVERFLDACLDSIEAQDYSDYEVVCVSDCGSDGSLEILRARAARDPRIRVFENAENRGVCFSRNRALREARGEYIRFVDPDDTITLGSTRALMAAAEASHESVVIGNYERIPEEAAEISPLRGSTDHSIHPRSELFRSVDESGRHLSSACGGVFLRSFLLENGLFFHEGMIAQEDTLFYFELSLNTETYCKIEAVCYSYRQRSGSVMHDRSEKRKQDYYRSMIIMLETYLDHARDGAKAAMPELREKIHHSKQNAATCLALCGDDDFVRKEFKYIKSKGYYPFKPRFAALKENESLLKRIMKVLIAIPPFFHIEHAYLKRRG